MNKFVLIILFFIAFCPISFGQNIEDELVKETLSNSPIPFVNSSYNYENTDKLPIRLEIVKPIKSELDVYEGQEVEFRVHKRAFFNDNLVIARGTKVLEKLPIKTINFTQKTEKDIHDKIASLQEHLIFINENILSNKENHRKKELLINDFRRTKQLLDNELLSLYGMKQEEYELIPSLKDFYAAN